MSGKVFTPNPIDEHIGQRIQLRRVMLGMSQKDLANICGVTFQQVQKYECAGNRISASRLFEISVALETPIKFFFCGLPGFMDSEPRNGHVSKLRVNDRTVDDPLSKNESLELLNLYWHLPSDEHRETIYKLLQQMAVNI